MVFYAKASIGKISDTHLKELEKKYLYANGLYIPNTNLFTKIVLHVMC